MGQTKNWLEKHSQELFRLSEDIFLHPEVAEQEHYACERLCAFLEEQGFSVTWPVGGLDTAFRADWGDTGPAIGLMAEYDALPDSFQKVEAVPSEAAQGPGHACGHQLIAAVCAGAAAALREWAERTGKSMRLSVFGCPAEETMKGKVALAKAGLFEGLDVAVCWHPEDFNGAVAYACSAISIVQYHFRGISAHAGAAPHLGRSALDACELMNVGANYLREHVEPSVRFHYAYLNAPAAPNVVPAEAALVYYIRGQDLKQVRAIQKRLGAVAEGAAMMAGVSCEQRTVTEVPETRPDIPLTWMADQVLSELTLKTFTGEELDFAEKLQKNSGILEAKAILEEGRRPFDGRLERRYGSSDVAAVSERVPTVMLRNTCVPSGIAQHHWAFAASCASTIGFRGMQNGIRFVTAFVKAFVQSEETKREGEL